MIMLVQSCILAALVRISLPLRENNEMLARLQRSIQQKATSSSEQSDQANTLKDPQDTRPISTHHVPSTCCQVRAGRWSSSYCSQKYPLRCTMCYEALTRHVRYRHDARQPRHTLPVMRVRPQLPCRSKSLSVFLATGARRRVSRHAGRTATWTSPPKSNAPSHSRTLHYVTLHNMI